MQYLAYVSKYAGFYENILSCPGKGYFTPHFQSESTLYGWDFTGDLTRKGYFTSDLYGDFTGGSNHSIEVAKEAWNQAIKGGRKFTLHSGVAVFFYLDCACLSRSDQQN